MKTILQIALRTTLITLVLTGLLYPLAITGFSQLLFKSRANGSWVTDQRGREVGSELIGQSFSAPGYFQPRPSAAGEKGYDASASTGSNLGPTSAKLSQRVTADLTRLQLENPGSPPTLPADLVTASGSGLDPHLSPEAVSWQIPRVARARHVSVDRIRTLIVAHTEPREWAIFGEPRINVLMLNLALDRSFGHLD